MRQGRVFLKVTNTNLLTQSIGAEPPQTQTQIFNRSVTDPQNVKTFGLVRQCVASTAAATGTTCAFACWTLACRTPIATSAAAAVAGGAAAAAAARLRQTLRPLMRLCQ